MAITLPHLTGPFTPIERKEIGTICQKVHVEHVRLPVRLNEESERMFRIYGSARETFIKQLSQVVDVVEAYGEFYVMPKKKTEEIQNCRLIRTYHNGIIEEVQSAECADENGYASWKGRRVYPNGTIETGDFRDFRLRVGTHTENGLVTFLNPKILVRDPHSKRGLMFLDIEGEKRLVVVQLKEAGTSWSNVEYIQIDEPLIPTLVKLLQEQEVDHNAHWYYRKDSLHEVLSGPIDCQEFFRYLFESQEIVIFNRQVLKVLLQIIKEDKAVANLLLQYREITDKLLDRHSENEDIVTQLIDLDPSLLGRQVEVVKHTFVQSLIFGNKSRAARLCEKMEKWNVSLMPRELLFKKCALSAAVTLDEVKSLLPEDQKILYQLANIYSRLDLIRTMNALGFSGGERLTREGPALFGCNMDTLEMHERLQGYLKELRSKKLLLTQKEFKALSPDHFINKGGDIGRILGRDYIEVKARELGLKHVKVPQKMFVINGKHPTLTLRTSSTLDIQDPFGEVAVYAERIQYFARQIRSEEVSELLRLFEACGYSDIHWGNVIVAKEGVYIIDTEFTNFWVAEFFFTNGRQYAEMVQIVHALPIEQQQPFIDRLNEQIQIYCQNEEAIDKQRILRYQREAAALKDTGCYYGPSFTFSIEELLS